MTSSIWSLVISLYSKLELLKEKFSKNKIYIFVAMIYEMSYFLIQILMSYRKLSVTEWWVCLLMFHKFALSSKPFKQLYKIIYLPINTVFEANVSHIWVVYMRHIYEAYIWGILSDSFSHLIDRYKGKSQEI